MATMDPKPSSYEFHHAQAEFVDKQSQWEANRRVWEEYWRRHNAQRPSGLDWRNVLGCDSAVTRTQAEAAYRRLAKQAHPDRGGSAEAMSRLNLAIADARRELP